MTLFLICVKIFFARILDVTIGTLRQSVMLKGHIYLTSLLAFLETLIWFIVAREALTINIESILIPLFYSLGYATGTLLGSFLSRKLIKGEVGLQVIVDTKDNSLLKALRARGYRVSIINLENDIKGPKKRMLFLEVNIKSLKKVENLITKNNPNAFITISDTKKVLNGTVK